MRGNRLPLHSMYCCVGYIALLGPCAPGAEGILCIATVGVDEILKIVQSVYFCSHSYG